ncbi:sulfotransferase [Bradyrhizobium genosp. A]|uniref:sulfotransferase n=1 Tax=Bradyrhizobium genosp. A TaxID=83626 RepID=UPI003CF8ECF7
MLKSERSPEPFVILAMPRSGTHYLEELLNEHPNVVSNGELLNEYDQNWPDKARLLRSDRELLECAYLRYPTPSDNIDVTHVGCKINEPQFHDRPGMMAELAGWPRLKVIVCRRNPLESLRSLVQARQTGEWLKYSSDSDDSQPPLVSLSVSSCETYFKTTAEFHDRIGQSFASTNILELEYETLLREPHLCLELVWEFLGVRMRNVSGRVKLQRQEVRPLDQTVEDFDELRRQFKEGPYARYFEAADA